MPATMARLMTRAVRVASRLAATIDFFAWVPPKASASRSAMSGVTSMFTRPTTPRSPNRARCALVSQTMLLVTSAPGSMVLNGNTFTRGLSTAPSPTWHSSATTTSSSNWTPWRTSAFLPRTHPRRDADVPT